MQWVVGGVTFHAVVVGGVTFHAVGGRGCHISCSGW